MQRGANQMTETRAKKSDAELNEGWAEPIFRPEAAQPSPSRPSAPRPARPSAPRSAPAGAMSPPHGIQSFSAVRLPPSPSLVATRAIPGPVKSNNAVWIGVAAVGGVLLLGVIGFGVRIAMSSPPAPAARV